MSGRTAWRARRRAPPPRRARAAGGRARPRPGSGAPRGSWRRVATPGRRPRDRREGVRLPGRSCSRLSHTTCVRRSPMRAAIAAGSGRGGAEPVGHRRQDELRIPERCERDEDRSSFCVVAEQTRQLDREPRLACSARADDREDTRVSLVDQRDGVEQLLLAAEERRRPEPGARRSPVSGAAGTRARRAGRGEPRLRSP